MDQAPGGIADAAANARAVGLSHVRFEAAAVDRFLRRQGLAGANSVVLPGAKVGEGATVGALSLVAESLEEWTVNAGVPARRRGDRDQSAVLAAASRFRRLYSARP